jgi:hypothetical protein
MSRILVAAGGLVVSLVGVGVALVGMLSERQR